METMENPGRDQAVQGADQLHPEVAKASRPCGKAVKELRSKQSSDTASRYVEDDIWRAAIADHRGADWGGPGVETIGDRTLFRLGAGRGLEEVGYDVDPHRHRGHVAANGNAQAPNCLLMLQDVLTFHGSQQARRG